MDKKRLKIVIVCSVLCLLIGIGYYIFFKLTNIGLICPIHELFHVDCPGCGISRMIFSIFELDFYQAFRYNPLLFIYLPFIIFIIVDVLKGYVHNRSPKYVSKVPIFVWIILFIITIGFGVIRNIEPFTFLRATEVREKK